MSTIFRHFLRIFFKIFSNLWHLQYVVFWFLLDNYWGFLMPCLRQLAYHTTLNFFCKAFFKEFCKNFYFFIFRPFIVQYVCFICIFIPNSTQAPYSSIPISRWIYFRFFRSLASFKGDKAMELSHHQRTELQRKKKEVEHPLPQKNSYSALSSSMRTCVRVRAFFICTHARMRVQYHLVNYNLRFHWIFRQ